MLPKYRGASPIQTAILNGDKVTGVTTMYINEKMDEGDIIDKKEVNINDDDTSLSLFNKMAIIGSDLLLSTIDNIEKGVAKREKQKGEATYTKKLLKENAKIDFNKPSYEMCNMIRAFNPDPIAYTYLDDLRIKIYMARPVKEEELKDSSLKEKISIGDYIIEDRRLYMKAKDGYIEVLELQADNKKRMNTKDFLNGFRG